MAPSAVHSAVHAALAPQADEDEMTQKALPDGALPVVLASAWTLLRLLLHWPVKSAQVKLARRTRLHENLMWEKDGAGPSVLATENARWPSRQGWCEESGRLEARAHLYSTMCSASS